MKHNKFKLSLLAMLLLIGFPTFSEASSATQIADDTILFTIDFMIDDELFDNEVPIAAEHGIAHNDRVDVVGYTIEGSKDTDLELEMVNAIVLSKASLSGTRYAVPKGEATTFTLFILATFREPLEENIYRARITKLPHFIDGRRTTAHQNELDALPTPTLEIE